MIFAEPDRAKMCTLIAELRADNSFLVIVPDTDTPTWHASVTLQHVGYLVEHRDEAGHPVKTTATDPQAIATELIAWLAERPDQEF